MSLNKTMITALKLCKFLLLAISCHCLISYANEPTTLKVGLITPERPPYFFNAEDGKPPTGLYIDILEKITENLPVKLEYHYLPQARIRKYMKNGKLDIEPGIDISWRILPGEVEVSLYTIPFMQSDEAYAYLGNKPEYINKKKGTVCGINGFNMPKSFSSKNIHLVTTEDQLYQMIIKKRCNLAVAPISVINYWNKNSPEKIHYGDVINSHQLRFRLNKRHKDLLKTLNQNIKSSQANKELESIKRKYIPLKEH